jgi:hypothetical protein
VDLRGAQFEVDIPDRMNAGKALRYTGREQRRIERDSQIRRKGFAASVEDGVGHPRAPLLRNRPTAIGSVVDQ